MPEKKRIDLIVSIDLDPVPGELHTRESARTAVAKVLSDRLEPYNPTVFNIVGSE